MGRLREFRRILSWIAATWPRRSKRRNPVEEAHAFFAERLTDSGKAVGFIWLASLPVAMIPGTSGWVVFVLLSAVLGVGILSSLRAPPLEVELLGCGRAVAGARMDVRLRLFNRSRRPVRGAGVALFRAFEGLEGRDEFAHVDSLAPGESKDLTVSVGCVSRGPTGFPGLGAVRADHFGLTRARRIAFSPVRVVVAPRPIRIVASSFLFGGKTGRAFQDAAGLGGDGERIFQGLREFREGDRIRDLDHKAWARWNAPVVREFAVSGGQGIAVSVRTGCDGLLQRALLEPMLRLACGVAVEFCRQGWLGGLWIDGVEASVRKDSATDVEAVFAGIGRCGWGKWPGGAGARPTIPHGMPVVSIGVASRVVESKIVQVAGVSKRILVVSQLAGMVPDQGLLALTPEELERAEVVL